MQDDDVELLKTFALAFGVLAFCMLFGAVLAALALKFFPFLWQLMFKGS
jgi:hypothetical protein